MLASQPNAISEFQPMRSKQGGPFLRKTPEVDLWNKHTQVHTHTYKRRKHCVMALVHSTTSHLMIPTSRKERTRYFLSQAVSETCLFKLGLCVFTSQSKNQIRTSFTSHLGTEFGVSCCSSTQGSGLGLSCESKQEMHRKFKHCTVNAGNAKQRKTVLR